MEIERLDFPFAATRRYGAEPLTLAFDILTLPFQISNMLTGFPELDIPVFGPDASGLSPYPTPAPAPTPTYTPTPAPVSGGGIEGTFGVIGLAGFPNGLAYQSITVGTQTFEAVRITWTGTIRNSGNAPLYPVQVALEAKVSGYSVPIRFSTLALQNLRPGESVPVSISADVRASDPPGEVSANLVVALMQQPIVFLGQRDSGVIGVINPVYGIDIVGGFGV